VARYIANRLLQLLPVLFLGSLIVFFTLRLVPPADIVASTLADTPGATDPVIRERLRQEFGLDRPAYVQYVAWILGAVHGDLGTSWASGRPVIQEIIDHLPVTLELTFISLVLSVIISVPLGTLAAVHRNSWLDYAARLIAIVGLSVPNFVVALVLLLGIALIGGWSPPLSFVAPWQDPAKHLQQMILPITSMAALVGATQTRMLRSAMLEVLGNDYIRTARAKGLREQAVIYRHALKNALIPVVTLLGTLVGFTLGGTVVIEQIYSLPGLGLLTLTSIQRGDFPQLQANILYLLVAFVVTNLFVDISYAWLDPRIKYA